VPEVFADTFYWIALLNPADKWHQKAISLSQSNPALSLVTTDAVLTEILNYFSDAGQKMRNAAAALCDHTLAHANTVVLPQTREAFAGGFDLYKARPDKGFSLTDCISMIEMRRQHRRCAHARSAFRPGRIQSPIPLNSR
jgi:predicted nucleic acid-binding protein